MNSHEEPPAKSRTPFEAQTPPADKASPAPTPVPTPGQTQSGKAVLLNWVIMLVGFCAIAFAAHWLIG
ncbi:hypothetical protein JWJ88_10125 [Paracoccus methylovorus]|uniref:Uncharacterized protein n=1 Tax=Paracoccus methylovorus TaxID=2812658 RepID=A0ABX7JFE9_9RHOB|nr:hypothetical protein [Paracoccus methylovorus]QRZ12937.1 hypothetical protein JWJ88_10125 [Paracoccus methylovorus]